MIVAISTNPQERNLLLNTIERWMSQSFLVDIDDAWNAWTMRFVEGIRNLVTTPAKRNERQSRLRIVPTADQMQTDMVWRLLTEQIEHGWDESLPKPAPNPDDLFRPALIGRGPRTAW